MIDPIAIRAGTDRVARVAAVASTPSVAAVQRVATPAASPADTAELSGVAADLASKPPIDEGRIALIKKAISDGTFPIAPAQIADRLLALRYDWMRNAEA